MTYCPSSPSSSLSSFSTSNRLPLAASSNGGTTRPKNGAKSSPRHDATLTTLFSAPARSASSSGRLVASSK